MKCMTCKNQCEGSLVLKDINLLNKKGEVIEWKLCKTCFNLWTNQEYDKLTKRLKGDNDLQKV